MKVDFTDNSDEIKGEIKKALLRGLTKVGQLAEKYAVQLCPKDTGNLRNSITYKVAEDEEAVYIGTNSEYGAYVELGTGEYYPGGRPTPWVYQDEKGNWHYTRGSKAQPFLKPAASDYMDVYQKIIKEEMENGQ